jgi:uncharacterized membrane protein
MTQNRWKSPVVWSSLVVQALSILVVLEAITPTQSETINSVIAAVLQALVVFGVLNSPTSKDSF